MWLEAQPEFSPVHRTEVLIMRMFHSDAGVSNGLETMIIQCALLPMLQVKEFEKIFPLGDDYVFYSKLIIIGKIQIW